MTVRLLTGAVWGELSRTTRECLAPSRVAVAYFSAGAGRALPLRSGSRLVVDASLAAVRAGQTHPKTLLHLVRRGVHVYSVANLHAKVFVIGKRAFVGSNNVSRSSANQLVEAAVMTTDRQIVEAARDFIDELCRDPLSPEVLRTLQRAYRSPRRPGAQAGSLRGVPRGKANVAPIRLVQLGMVEWPMKEAALQKSGETLARSRREHRRGWALQCYRWPGKCSVNRHDTIVQVVEDHSGRRFVEPPGKVLHVARRVTARGRVAYVYVEVPVVARRVSVEQLAKHLGRGTRKLLLRGGRVRDSAFGHRLLRALER